MVMSGFGIVMPGFGVVMSGFGVVMPGFGMIMPEIGKYRVVGGLRHRLFFQYIQPGFAQQLAFYRLQNNTPTFDVVFNEYLHGMSDSNLGLDSPLEYLHVGGVFRLLAFFPGRRDRERQWRTFQHSVVAAGRKKMEQIVSITTTV